MAAIRTIAAAYADAVWSALASSKPRSRITKDRDLVGADYYGVDPAFGQTALRFAVDNPDIHTTLVGTASPQNMLGNIKILETPLDLEFIKEIQKILEPIRDKSWLSGLEENN